MILPKYRPDVLPGIRKMRNHDPTVFEVNPLYLQGSLKDEGYLPYWTSLSDVGTACNALAVEQRGPA